MPLPSFRLAPYVVVPLALLLAACQAGPTAATRTSGLGRPDLAPGDLDGPSSPDSQPAAANWLKGLAANDVLEKLGDPNYRRREAPAEVWQYFGPGCVLDLFLYEETGAQRVTHVELRSRTPNQGADAACLSQLLTNRRVDANS